MMNGMSGGDMASMGGMKEDAATPPADDGKAHGYEAVHDDDDDG